MTSINLLKSKMAAKGYTNFTADLMSLLGISYTTASQKLNNKSTFDQTDISILSNALDLSGDDIKQIFADGNDQNESQ